MKNALRQSFYILGIAVVSFGFFGIHLALGFTNIPAGWSQIGATVSGTILTPNSSITSPSGNTWIYFKDNGSGNEDVGSVSNFYGNGSAYASNPCSSFDPTNANNNNPSNCRGYFANGGAGSVASLFPDGTYIVFSSAAGAGSAPIPTTSTYIIFTVSGGTVIPADTPNNNSYIRLVYPINGTTTPYFTTPNNFNPVLEYYWGSTLGSTSPSLVQISVTPVGSSFFGLSKPSPINLYVNFGGSNIVQTITGSLDNASSSLQQGQYTWKASLIATTTTDLNSYCVSVLFWLCTHGVATSTLISSNPATFQVGNGGQFSTTTDKGNTTSSILDYCQDYSGSDGVVKALCFIPNSISAIVTTIFVPPQGTVDADFSVIQNDFNTTLTIWPVGYMTRFVSILSATSTATSSLPTIAYTFPTSTPFLGGVEWDLNPWQYFYEGGSWISSLKSAGAKPEDVWTIFEPVINMILIIVLLYEIIHDLSGFRHHERDFSSHENKSGIIKGK